MSDSVQEWDLGGGLVFKMDKDGHVAITLVGQTLMIVPRAGLVPVANALIKAHVYAGRLPKE